jgi:hypothetical protein
VSAPTLLEVLEGILQRDEDPEDALQATVTAIVERGGARWAAVLLNNDGELVVGPEAGVAEPGERREAQIVLEGAHLGVLQVDGLDDQPLIDRVASLIAPLCNRLI